LVNRLIESDVVRTLLTKTLGEIIDQRIGRRFACMRFGGSARDLRREFNVGDAPIHVVFDPLEFGSSNGRDV
jgi:hypothetical protein